MTDVELDLAVAEAARIVGARISNNFCGHNQACIIPGRGVVSWDIYQPSHSTLGWNDAMEALKLYLNAHPPGWRFTRQLRKVLSGVYHKYPCEWMIPELVRAGPRAICEAIVAMKGGE